MPAYAQHQMLLPLGNWNVYIGTKDKRVAHSALTSCRARGDLQGGLQAFRTLANTQGYTSMPRENSFVRTTSVYHLLG